jgi:hypothetical protein
MTRKIESITNFHYRKLRSSKYINHSKNQTVNVCDYLFVNSKTAEVFKVIKLPYSVILKLCVNHIAKF